MRGVECLGEVELRAFLLGTLPERVSLVVAAHVEDCPDCERAARELDRQTDPLIRALRRATQPATAGHGLDSTNTVRSPAPASALPRFIAGYEVLEEIGRGGMSAVYKAHQSHPDRLVALKFLLDGVHASPERRTRLLAEADAIARLRHPHIVQIFEVAQHDGLPFLALEFVSGGSLAQHLRGQPQPPRDAATLVLMLARTIHYCHEHGVVHRDLKPGNILLQKDEKDKTHSSFGSSFHPKITDFGLAKQAEAELTATGAVLGTPNYMAPEQAAGNNKTVGPAADVFALGAILYEMISGRPPFQAATALETLQQVQTLDPAPPSQLQARTPRDLNTICLHCLQKTPEQRYGSAWHLADDLQRFLEGQPILARPVGAPERVWRWSRRNPGWAAMLGSVAVLLVTIAIGASAGLFQLHQALTESEGHRQDSDRNLERARRAENAAQEKLFDSLLMQARATSRSRRGGQRFGSLAAVDQAHHLARELQLPPKRLLDLRNAAISALALADLQIGPSWAGAPEGWVGFDFDAAVALYARMDSKGNCEVRRVSGNQLLWQLPSPSPGGPAQAGPFMRHDGRVVAFAAGGRCPVWELAPDGPVLLCEEKNVVAVEYHPRTALAALAHFDGAISLYDLKDRRLLRRLTPGAAKRDVSLAFHPTRPLLAVASYFADAVVIRNFETGAVLHSLDIPPNAFDVAWDPRGHILAVAEGDGSEIHLFDGATYQQLRTLRTGGDGTRIAFNPVGDRLAAKSWTDELRLFDVATGKLLIQAPWGTLTTSRLRYSRDGRRITGERRGDLLGIMELDEGRAFRTLLDHFERHSEYVPWADVGPDNRLLSVWMPGGIHFWDLATGDQIGRLPDDSLQIALFEPPNPGALVTAGPSGIQRWPLRWQGEDPATVRIGPPKVLSSIHARQMEISRDGRSLALSVRKVGSYQRFAGGWLLRPGLPGPLELDRGKDVAHIALSPDGRWAVSVIHDSGVVKIWDTRDGREVKKLTLRNGSVTTACFSPDGQWLAISGEAGRLLAVGTWEPGLAFSGRPQFSPDSRVLAVANATEITLVDVGHQRELARLASPNLETCDVHTFSPDGTRLVLAYYRRDGGLYAWDLRTLRRELKALDLDWEAPDYPPATPHGITPLRLEIVR